MLSIQLCTVLIVYVMICVNAKHYTFNEPNMPIRVVQTSFGQGNRERIDHLYAEIHPKHLSKNNSMNFPTSGSVEDWYKGIRAPGDERGHLVSSQFSGPPNWYNLSPQNARVNRDRGHMSISTDWYESLKKVLNDMCLGL